MVLSQLSNFAAEVALVPNASEDDGTIRLLPHPIYDAAHFANVHQLSTVAQRDGYSGACLLRVHLPPEIRALGSVCWAPCARIPALGLPRVVCVRACVRVSACVPFPPMTMKNCCVLTDVP